MKKDLKVFFNIASESQAFKNLEGAKALVSLEEEIIVSVIEQRARAKALADAAGHKIILDVEHLAIPRIDNKKVSGLHTNALIKKITDNGIKLSNLKMHSSQAYKADVFYKGVLDEFKTFFPDYMTLENIVDLAYECIATIDKDILQEKSKRISHTMTTKYGFEVQIVLDTNINKVVTFMPIKL